MRGTVCLPNFLTKELLKRFGFPYHTAPGEAEAECALLQKQNIVDAVMSEDVDTMMFGCSRTMRSWTPEGTRGNKSPTHVNVYNADSVREKTGLDSEGMILIALLSGGDYIPAGIPGCGIKTAYEAATAGFGRDLCQLSKDDIDGLRQWRERLEREFQTNESKFFCKKRKTIKIPENFPDKAVWGYYTHPVVSSAEKVARLHDEIKWKNGIDVPELRRFVADAFDWQYLSGAKKFIRGLAPALLGHQLICRDQSHVSDNEDPQAKEMAEKCLVKSICGRRKHWNTCGEPELRIAYIPIDIVGLDLDAEEKDSFQGYGQDASGDEQPASEGDERTDSKSLTKRRGPSNYDPIQVEKIWVLETYLKLGVPMIVETWEEEMRNPKKFATRKAREKAKTATFKNPKGGALDTYVKVTKPRPDLEIKLPVKGKESTQLPSALFASTVDIPVSQQQKVLAENIHPLGQKVQKQPAKAKTARTRKAPPADQTSSPTKDRVTNPWTLAKRTPQPPRFKSPPRHASQTQDNIEGARSPQGTARRPTSPPAKKRHSRPSTPISDPEDPAPTTPINKNITLRKPNPSTPTPHDPSKPSPRKKRSPLQIASDLHLAGQVRTLSKPPANPKTTGNVADADTDPPTPRPANRKLDFTEPHSPATAASSPTSLPSPSTLFSPPPDPSDLQVSKAKVDLSGTCTETRRLVALRESLEGAWKHVEAWEEGVGSSRRRVFSSVEVVDLSGG